MKRASLNFFFGIDQKTEVEMIYMYASSNVYTCSIDTIHPEQIQKHFINGSEVPFFISQPLAVTPVNEN